MLRARSMTLLEAGDRAAQLSAFGDAWAAYASDGDWRVFAASDWRVYDLDGRELTVP